VALGYPLSEAAKLRLGARYAGAGIRVALMILAIVLRALRGA